MKNINGYTITKIARILNVSHVSVVLWFQGKTKPTANRIFILEDKIGIPPNAWRDIKSYLSENTTKPKNCAQELPPVTQCDDGNKGEKI
jgi:transcriptional regulator with XRE-family HTH domain